MAQHGDLIDNCKGEKHDIKLVIPRKNTVEPFEPSEKALYLIAPPVQFFVIFPRLQSIEIWRYHRRISQIAVQPPCLVAFVCAVRNIKNRHSASGGCQNAHFPFDAGSSRQFPHIVPE
jgi:hypothetical protein